MARVIRMVWRLDFDPSYAYLDHRGSALDALTNTVEDFWKSVGPGQIPLSFAAEALEDDQHRHFSWEVPCINGGVEWPAGIDLDRLLENRTVKMMDRIAKRALQIGEVKILKRAGVRLFCVEDFAKDGDANERVNALITKGLRSGVAELLGKVDDVALIYEGVSDDQLGYRVQFGPYAEKNPTVVFQKEWKEEQRSSLTDSDLFIDIDIYQKDFSFAEHSLYRWLSTKISKAANFIEFCSKNV